MEILPREKQIWPLETWNGHSTSTRETVVRYLPSPWRTRCQSVVSSTDLLFPAAFILIFGWRGDPNSSICPQRHVQCRSVRRSCRDTVEGWSGTAITGCPLSPDPLHDPSSPRSLHVSEPLRACMPPPRVSVLRALAAAVSHATLTCTQLFCRGSVTLMGRTSSSECCVSLLSRPRSLWFPGS